LTVIPVIDYTGSWNISLDWFGWLCLAVPVVFVVLLISRRSKNRKDREVASDLKFEGDLNQAIASLKASPQASTWNPPILPSSLIASIWTDRFTMDSKGPPSDTQRYGSTLKAVTWDYRREAPLIVAVALLSLRDAGLIRMAIQPRGKHLQSFQRITIERTEVSLSNAELPHIEGGLLLACLDLAHTRFRKVTQPSVFRVVAAWIGGSLAHPFKWVVDVAAQDARKMGLYQPVTKKRAWYGRMVPDSPVYALEHLAACDGQATVCAARWQQFGADEPDLQQTLLTEAAFAISGATTSGG
jgi:hypothetical protein